MNKFTFAEKMTPAMRCDAEVKPVGSHFCHDPLDLDGGP
jgi:hypothetical protein